MTRFILVRHGQTSWNQTERFRGRSDIPLNESGLLQAAAAGSRIAKIWHPTAIYSSALSRAMLTAEAIARPLELIVQPHPALLDIDFGEWQGLDSEEVHKGWPVELDHWIHAPHLVQFPGGERMQDARDRVLNGVISIAEKHPDETIALVSHAVINRLLILAILDLGIDKFWKIGQSNTAINVFEYKASEFTLVTLNDISHITG